MVRLGMGYVFVTKNPEQRRAQHILFLILMVRKNWGRSLTPKILRPTHFSCIKNIKAEKLVVGVVP